MSQTCTYEPKGKHVAGLDFDRYDPPPLTERALRRELERRRLRRQTALLALAGALMQVALVMAGVALAGTYPLAALLAFGYALFTATGGSAIAAAFALKGRMAA